MRFLAGVVIGYGILWNILTGVATFIGESTPADRMDWRYEGIVVLILGCILWQLTNKRG